MQKKSSVKKATKPVARRAAPVAPEMHECHCGASCGCGCHCGKFKKFIVLLIVFVLGFAVAKITCCHGRRHMPNMHPKFENGCLVMDSIKCPKMRADLAMADVDMDGCISREEFRAVKKSMHNEMRKHHERFEERDDD